MLGKNLEELLRQKELTVTELSKATGIARTTLLGWIKGTSASPNLEQLDKVARHLKVSIEELAFGRKTKKPEITDLFDNATVHVGHYRLTVEKMEPK